MTYTTPELPYAYDALEPYLDEENLRIHHQKHHPAYTGKLNATLEGNEELSAKSPEWLVENCNEVPEAIRQKVINFAGGHVNHEFFWNCMKKDVPAEGAVVDAIVAQWESLDAFKEAFATSAVTLFGSGWTWLVKKADGSLAIVNTQNQDSPLSEGMTPLLTLDVWEHAYYLKYRNARPDFVNNWWNVVNWEFVNKNFEA